MSPISDIFKITIKLVKIQPWCKRYDHSIVGQMVKKPPLPIETALANAAL